MKPKSKPKPKGKPKKLDTIFKARGPITPDLVKQYETLKAEVAQRHGVAPEFLDHVDGRMISSKLLQARNDLISLLFSAGWSGPKIRSITGASHASVYNARGGTYNPTDRGSVARAEKVAEAPMSDASTWRGRGHPMLARRNAAWRILRSEGWGCSEIAKVWGISVQLVSNVLTAGKKSAG